MGVAVNVLKSHRRQLVRTRQVPGSDLGERWDALLERLCTKPHDEALGDRLDLRQALEQLDEKDRRALLLRYFDGLDGEELARALGARTTGAARVRVCRALRALRARLGLAESEVES
jgi:RNA polymerase sigma factor (sigma-70 family)